MQTVDKKIIAGLYYEHNEEQLIIPMPDMTLIYFDFAYGLNKSRIKSKEDIFSRFNKGMIMEEMDSIVLYNFYGCSASIIINLYTCLESYVNSLFPKEKEYVSEKKNRTEYYNYEQIQRYIELDEKITKVLPQFYNQKNFFKSEPLHKKNILQLKDIRHQIIHHKSDSAGATQVELFRKLIDFDYDGSLESVFKFLRFYKDDYIIECPCSNDF